MLKKICKGFIKVVANSKLGADKITLLHLYRSLVRSIVLYMDRLELRDAIHHHGVSTDELISYQSENDFIY